MATTKIWPTKGHLASVLKYIVNEQKTDAKTHVSGLNCFPDTAASEMNAVKKPFEKTGTFFVLHLPAFSISIGDTSLVPSKL